MKKKELEKTLETQLKIECYEDRLYMVYRQFEYEGWDVVGVFDKTGMFSFKYKGFVGIVNVHGQLILAPCITNIDYYIDTSFYMTICINNKWYIIDYLGNWLDKNKPSEEELIKVAFYKAGDFGHWYMNPKGKWTLIDTKYKKIIDEEYDDVKVYMDEPYKLEFGGKKITEDVLLDFMSEKDERLDYIAVCKDNDWGILSRYNGETVIKIGSMSSSCNECPFNLEANDELGYTNTILTLTHMDNGNTTSQYGAIITGYYTYHDENLECDDFNEGAEGDWDFTRIPVEERPVVPPVYDEIDFSSPFKIACLKDGKWWYFFRKDLKELYLSEEFY